MRGTQPPSCPETQHRPCRLFCTPDSPACSTGGSLCPSSRPVADACLPVQTQPQKQEGNLQFFPQEKLSIPIIQFSLTAQTVGSLSVFPAALCPHQPGPSSHTRPPPRVWFSLSVHARAPSLGLLHCLWRLSVGHGRFPGLPPYSSRER